jgi:hypothetical protein
MFGCIAQQKFGRSSGNPRGCGSLVRLQDRRLAGFLEEREER